MTFLAGQSLYRIFLNVDDNVVKCHLISLLFGWLKVFIVFWLILLNASVFYSLHVHSQVYFCCWVTYLSQAEKSIIRVSSFSFLQNFNFWLKKFTVIPKKLFGTWQFDFIIQKFARLKSKIFSQFFWWEPER